MSHMKKERDLNLVVFGGIGILTVGILILNLRGVHSHWMGVFAGVTISSMILLLGVGFVARQEFPVFWIKVKGWPAKVYGYVVIVTGGILLVLTLIGMILLIKEGV